MRPDDGDNDDPDEALLGGYIAEYIDQHRMIFEGFDEAGRPVIRAVRAYCPACLDDDHAGRCPVVFNSERH